MKFFLKRKHLSTCLTYLSIFGPGIVVMLADTDAGSVIVAAQSGAIWGYKLLFLQFILMPILFITQELTVRLGLVTGKGHGELIKKEFGTFWAWISVSTLLVCCVGAIITELSGLASVGALADIPVRKTMTLTLLFLIFIAWTGTYRSVELIALCIGAFELVFLWVAFKAHPSLSEIKTQLIQIPWHNQNFLYLMAGNIGAVIMPWMIFYQQSALLDKGLSAKHLKIARWDTAIGAFITQLIMAAVLITTAASLGKTHPGSLNTVQDITNALTPTLGDAVGKLLFSLGMIGASLVATIVVSLTAAWGLGEILGYRRSLQDHPLEAPWFYGVYTLTLIAGGLVVASGINLVKLSVAVEVMNALLLPIVLGFLYMLAWKTLPEPYRLKGKYAVFTGIILGATSLFGLIAGLMGIF
ncbi:MAG: NRAMP family metal ion transporter [Gammaproteobacteria bacterium RIFCSPLOWO2_02_FULL_38_11]|nr:MAG: NRAMP family metal ion transporter [Gammaproteobacteria bacterium RIFCSPLOWO2_02_FULL_38_11]